MMSSVKFYCSQGSFKKNEVVKLKSYFCKIYVCHHELVDLYGIFIDGIVLMLQLQSHPLTLNLTYLFRLINWNVFIRTTWRVPYGNQDLIFFPYQSTWDHQKYVVGFVLLSLSVSMLCTALLFVCRSLMCNESELDQPVLVRSIHFFFLLTKEEYKYAIHNRF